MADYHCKLGKDGMLPQGKGFNCHVTTLKNPLSTMYVSNVTLVRGNGYIYITIDPFCYSPETNPFCDILYSKFRNSCQVFIM